MKSMYIYTLRVKNMKTIKINNKLRIQEHSEGLKMYIKLKNKKWTSVKINKNESELLKLSLSLLN